MVQLMVRLCTQDLNQLLLLIKSSTGAVIGVNGLIIKETHLMLWILKCSSFIKCSRTEYSAILLVDFLSNGFKQRGH
jgi:hypothetical protein